MFFFYNIKKGFIFDTFNLFSYILSNDATIALAMNCFTVSNEMLQISAADLNKLTLYPQFILSEIQVLNSVSRRLGDGVINWNSFNPCTFQGVICIDESSVILVVSSIFLSNQTYKGKICSIFCIFTLHYLSHWVSFTIIHFVF